MIHQDRKMTAKEVILQNQHGSLVKGAGSMVLDYIGETLGLTYLVRKLIAPVGITPLMAMIPRDRRRGRIHAVDMLLLSPRRSQMGFHHKLVSDYDFWKTPEAGACDYRRLDIRFPETHWDQWDRKDSRKGDLVSRGLSLWNKMSNRVQDLYVDEAGHRLEFPAMHKLGVEFQLSELMVGLTDMPQGMEEAAEEAVIPPDIEENTTGLFLVPLDVFAEMPRGPIFENFSNVVNSDGTPIEQVIYRSVAYDDLRFETGTEGVPVELDLTQRFSFGSSKGRRYGNQKTGDTPANTVQET